MAKTIEQAVIELPQLALAKVFPRGDRQSGYHHNQTLILALGVITLHEFFPQRKSEE